LLVRRLAVSTRTSRHAIPAALGAIVLWATLASLARVLGRWPPFLLTGAALLIGSLPSAPLVRRWRVPWPTLALGVYGLAGYHAALFCAFRLAPAMEANLLNYLWPTFIVVLSPLVIPGTRLRAGHVAGALAGLAGAVLIVTRGRAQIDGAHLPGDALAVLAALVWATYSLLSKRVAPFPDAAVGLFCAVSGAISLALHAAFEARYHPAASEIGWLVALGIGPMGAAFLLWNYAMTRGDPRTIGVLAYLAPLLSTLLLGLVTGEFVTLVTVVAGALIVGGAALGTLAGREARLPARGD
jgi:drug/metabolite transporter (DMT)-like permease